MPKKSNKSLNGKHPGKVTPVVKPPCILDDAMKYLEMLKPGDWLTKNDDRSGFFHAHLDPLSRTQVKKKAKYPEKAKLFDSGAL